MLLRSIKKWSFQVFFQNNCPHGRNTSIPSITYLSKHDLFNDVTVHPIIWLSNYFYTTVVVGVDGACTHNLRNRNFLFSVFSSLNHNTISVKCKCLLFLPFSLPHQCRHMLTPNNHEHMCVKVTLACYLQISSSHQVFTVLHSLLKKTQPTCNQRTNRLCFFIINPHWNQWFLLSNHIDCSFVFRFINEASSQHWQDITWQTSKVYAFERFLFLKYIFVTYTI